MRETGLENSGCESKGPRLIEKHLLHFLGGDSKHRPFSGSGMRYRESAMLPAMQVKVSKSLPSRNE